MQIDLAKKILENELQSPHGHIETHDFIIDYFGGEPLTNFELIRDVSEWLWHRDWPYPYKLRVRTNGTLLTDDMKLWFLRNRERIELALSLDGIQDMHTINRSHLIPDVSFFTNNWPSVRVKMVLFPDSIHLLSEAVLSMNEKNIAFEADIGSGFEWSEDKASVLEEQLCSLIPVYLLRPQEAMECKLFQTSPASFFPENPPQVYPFCGHVSNIVAYDIDGTDYCCHMFSPVVLGRSLAEKSRQLCATAREYALDEECIKCPLVNNCKLCYSDNLRICGEYGKSAARSTTCRALKAMGRASAKLFMENIRYREEHQLNIDSDEYLLVDKSIKLLQTI